MRASFGGVSQDYIDGLTFPELVELWEVGIRFKS
jgi:hypothetical protein